MFLKLLPHSVSVCLSVCVQYNIDSTSAEGAMHPQEREREFYYNRKINNQENPSNKTYLLIHNSGSSPGYV